MCCLREETPYYLEEKPDKQDVLQVFQGSGLEE